MKKKLLNVVTFVLIGWGAFSATYLALPPELKDMLPEMNWVTAVVSGGSTTLLGTASLYIQNYINKFKTANNQVLTGLFDTIATIKNDYTQITESYNNIVESNKELITQYKVMASSLEKNSLLLKTELQTKLSNPLLTTAARDLIEGVLNDEEESI